LLLFQIGLFCRLGCNQANEGLDVLLKEAISAAEESRIKDKNCRGTRSDAVSLERQFNKTDSLGDLASLVDELEARKDWEIFLNTVIFFLRELAHCVTQND
jgi:hypothetical protein